MVKESKESMLSSCCNDDDNNDNEDDIFDSDLNKHEGYTSRNIGTNIKLLLYCFSSIDPYTYALNNSDVEKCK